MKPAAFAYDAPETLEEALALLAEHGDEAKVLAGGQSLVPLLNFRLARPARLVDLNRVAGLGSLRAEGGALRIGALVRQAELDRSRVVAESWPLLAQAVRFVGHPQTRSRGTVCGSAAHADPAAELPAALVALEAVFHIRSAAAARTLSAEEFFVGVLTSALAPDEVLVEIEVPPPPAGARSAFAEHALVHGDFAIAGAAVLAAGGSVRIGLLGVDSRPVVVASAEEAEATAGEGWRRALVGALVRSALEAVA